MGVEEEEQEEGKVEVVMKRKEEVGKKEGVEVVEMEEMEEEEEEEQKKDAKHEAEDEGEQV